MIQNQGNKLNIQFGTATPEQKIIIRQKIRDLNEQLYSAYGRIAKLTRKIAELKD